MTLWHQSHQSYDEMCGSRSHRPGSLSMNHLEHTGPSTPQRTPDCWHCWSHPHWLQDRDHLGSRSNYIDLWSLWLMLMIMMSDYDVNACVINVWSSDDLWNYDYIKQGPRVRVTCDLIVNMMNMRTCEFSYEVSGKTPYGVHVGADPSQWSTTFSSWIRNCVSGLLGPRCGALRADPVPLDSSSSMYSPWLPKLKLYQSNSTSSMSSCHSSIKSSEQMELCRHTCSYGV